MGAPQPLDAVRIYVQADGSLRVDFTFEVQMPGDESGAFTKYVHGDFESLTDEQIKYNVLADTLSSRGTPNELTLIRE